MGLLRGSCEPEVGREVFAVEIDEGSVNVQVEDDDGGGDTEREDADDAGSKERRVGVGVEVEEIPRSENAIQ